MDALGLLLSKHQKYNPKLKTQINTIYKFIHKYSLPVIPVPEAIRLPSVITKSSFGKAAGLTLPVISNGELCEAQNLKIKIKLFDPSLGFQRKKEL